MNSYATEVIADDSGTWAGNGLRWPLTPEGHKAATEHVADLMGRWLLVRETRVIESPDEPTEGVKA